jgi:hypothetical protein
LRFYARENFLSGQLLKPLFSAKALRLAVSLKSARFKSEDMRRQETKNKSFVKAREVIEVIQK